MGDELGRGTSTFDGTAIAGATVKHLIERNRCITLFATHYHSLLEDWKDNEYVRLGHMECLVEEAEKKISNDADDNEITDNVTDHNITFLYTLGEGSCPKSFGINVAYLAGLPPEVLSKAKDVSRSFEEELSRKQSNSSTVMSLRKNLEIAVATKDWGKVERLWGELALS